ncbi:MAG: O-antigen ligase family protein [Burkholderiales bacterium]|nr:O-antigen ligase family protein [Burkholderiales bacterium]
MQRVFAGLGLKGIAAVDVAKVGLLFVAIFSGRYSFDRVLDESSRMPILEIRYWSLAALVAVIALAPRGASPVPLLPDRNGRWLLIGIVVFHLYLLANLLVIGNPAVRAVEAANLAVIVIIVALTPLVVRARPQVVVFALFGEALGMALFALALAGLGNPDLNGLGWAPLGGPITFYRVEFMAACCALFFILDDRLEAKASLWHWAVFATTLFSALASLSKAATLGAFVAVGALVFVLFARGRIRLGVGLATSTAVVFAAFFWFNQELIERRLAVAAVSTQPPASLVARNLLAERARQAGAPTVAAREMFADIGSPEAVLARIYAGEDVTLATVSPEERAMIEAYRVLIGHALPRPDQDLRAFLEGASAYLLVPDGSDRLRMAIGALGYLHSAPWVGVGLGNALYPAVDRNRDRIDLYYYPHNIFLEQLAVGGIAGFLLFAVPALGALLLIVRRTLFSDASLSFLAYLVFVVVTASLSGNYFDFRLFWVVALVGAVAGQSEARTPTTGSGPRARS